MLRPESFDDSDHQSRRRIGMLGGGITLALGCLVYEAVKNVFRKVDTLNDLQRHFDNRLAQITKDW